MLRQNPWLVFLLPFVVFMLVGSLEPTPDAPGGKSIGLAIPYAQYPVVYTIKIALTLAAIGFVLPGYRQFPFRISLLAIAVGVVGVVIWIGLCRLDLEHTYLQPAFERSRFGLDNRLRRACGLQSVCAICRPAGLGLDIFGDPFFRAGPDRAGDRRVFPARFCNAICR